MVKKPTKFMIISALILMSINLFLSYTFSGRSIAYVFGNVFGLTMIVIAISSIFKRYRNPYSMWLIFLNIMIITLISLMGNVLINVSDKVAQEYMEQNDIKDKSR